MARSRTALGLLLAVLSLHFILGVGLPLLPEYRNKAGRGAAHFYDEAGVGISGPRSTASTLSDLANMGIVDDLAHLDEDGLVMEVRKLVNDLVRINTGHGNMTRHRDLSTSDEFFVDLDRKISFDGGWGWADFTVDVLRCIFSWTDLGITVDKGIKCPWKHTDSKHPPWVREMWATCSAANVAVTAGDRDEQHITDIVLSASSIPPIACTMSLAVKGVRTDYLRFDGFDVIVLDPVLTLCHTLCACINTVGQFLFRYG